VQHLGHAEGLSQVDAEGRDLSNLAVLGADDVDLEGVELTVARVAARS
jgi:hypothetical protein